MIDSLIKNFDVVDISDGKTTIEFTEKPKYIMGRDGLINIEEEYKDIIFEDDYDLNTAIEQGLVDVSRLQEYAYILQHFTLPRTTGKVILDTEDVEAIGVVGRTDGIKELEKSKGIEYEREMVWLNGAESTSGIIVLPYDNYDKVYVIEGEDSNYPQDIRFVDEYQEGMERPYYKKVDGETHIYVNHFSGGGGTQESPYGIRTKEDLIAIGTRATWSFHYILMNDIDLDEDGNWTPLNFRGTFDGNGKTISNKNRQSLQPYDSGVTSSGLFGSLVGATIRNLKLSDIIVNRLSYSNVGLFANYISTNSLIENIHIDKTCALVVGYSNTFLSNYGGISANLSASIVRNCLIENDIRGIRVVGAVAGNVTTGSSIENCLYTGNVYSDLVEAFDGGKIGGIIGQISSDSTVVSSYGSLTRDFSADLLPSVRISDEALANQSTFVGWDFENTWTMGESHPLLKTFLSLPNVTNIIVNAYTNIVSASQSKMFSKFASLKSHTKNFFAKSNKVLKSSRDSKSFTKNIFASSGIGLSKFVNALSYMLPFNSNVSSKLIGQRMSNSFIKPIHTKLSKLLQNVRRPLSTVSKIESNMTRVVSKHQFIESFVKPIMSSSFGTKVKRLTLDIKSYTQMMFTQSKMSLSLTSISALKRISSRANKVVKVFRIKVSYTRRFRGRAGKMRGFIIRVNSHTRLMITLVRKTFKLPEGRFLKVFAELRERYQTSITGVKFIRSTPQDTTNKKETIEGSDEDGFKG